MSISISIPLATSKTPHDPTPRADAVPTDRFETALEDEQVPTDSTPRMRKPRPATEASQEAATRTSPSEGERDAREDAPDTTTEDHAVDAPGAHVQSAATAWTPPIPTPPAETADAGDIAKAIDPKATDEVLSTVPRSVGMPPSFAALAPEDTPATPVFAALGDETPTASPSESSRTDTDPERPTETVPKFGTSPVAPSPAGRPSADATTLVANPTVASDAANATLAAATPPASNAGPSQSTAKRRTTGPTSTAAAESEPKPPINVAPSSPTAVSTEVTRGADAAGVRPTHDTPSTTAPHEMPAFVATNGDPVVVATNLRATAAVAEVAASTSERGAVPSISRTKSTSDAAPAPASVGARLAVDLATHNVEQRLEASRAPGPETFEKILESLRGELKQRADHITLRLDPAELGKVEVRLLARGDAITVRVAADRDDVADLLRRDQSALHKVLNEAGVNVAHLDVRAGLDQRARHDRWERPDGNRQTAVPDFMKPKPLASTASRMFVRTEGRLDVLA